MVEFMNGEECKMTFSAFVHDKTGKRIVRVSFERVGSRGAFPLRKRRSSLTI